MKSTKTGSLSSPNKRVGAQAQLSSEKLFSNLFLPFPFSTTGLGHRNAEERTITNIHAFQREVTFHSLSLFAIIINRHLFICGFLHPKDICALSFAREIGRIHSNFGPLSFETEIDPSLSERCGSHNQDGTCHFQQPFLRESRLFCKRNVCQM